MYLAGPLVTKPIFTIFLDDDDHCLIKCSSHKCCISKDSLLQSDINLQYTYKKVIRRFVSTILYSYKSLFKYTFLYGQLSLTNASKNRASWYLVMHSSPGCVRTRHYSRLPFPRTATSSEAPIQPGLFAVTTVSIRGYPDMNDIRVCPTTSLVMLTYDEHWKIATGHQITVIVRV